MSFWQGKRVLVTGGAGFIGSHLVELLLNAGAHVRVVDGLSNGSQDNLAACRGSIDFMEGDLRDEETCRRSCLGMDVVMHLAAKVGGVGYNIAHPADMLSSNVLLNNNMMEAARRENVDRYLCVSSACIYPRFCSVPTPESEGFDGDPEPSNLGYGWAKRLAEVQARCYREEYGMSIAIVRPYNAYGPRDHFDLETGHVIPALIRKVLDGQDPLVVWGDGLQTRAFVYVTDIARGMMLATERHAVADPLNIGTDEEVTIRDLAHLVVKASGRTPTLFFDTDKPSGQPRRNADVAKARETIAYQPEVRLKKGLGKTIEWCLERRRW